MHDQSGGATVQRAQTYDEKFGYQQHQNICPIDRENERQIFYTPF